jgi:hypothetical protein
MTSMIDLPSDHDRDSRATTTVAKVIGIMQAVSRADGPIGVRELSRVSGIDRSAVSRIATSLRELGVLAATSDGSCAPGPELWALSDRLRRASSMDVESARVIGLVCGTTGETAFSLVGEGDSQHVAHVEIGRGPVTVMIATGAASPFAAAGLSASGDADDPLVTAPGPGVVYLGREVGLDERGRRWSVAVAIPDQRALRDALERASAALEVAVSELRRVTAVALP